MAMTNAEKQAAYRDRRAARKEQRVELFLPTKLWRSVEAAARAAGRTGKEVAVERLAGQSIPVDVKPERALKLTRQLSGQLQAAAEGIRKRLRTKSKPGVRHDAETAIAALELAAGVLGAAKGSDGSPEPVLRVLRKLWRTKSMTLRGYVDITLYDHEQAAVRLALARYVDHLKPEIGCVSDYDAEARLHAAGQLAVAVWHKVPKLEKGRVCLKLDAHESRFVVSVLKWFALNHHDKGRIKGAPWLEVHHFTSIISRLSCP